MAKICQIAPHGGDLSNYTPWWIFVKLHTHSGDLSNCTLPGGDLSNCTPVVEICQIAPLWWRFVKLHPRWWFVKLHFPGGCLHQMSNCTHPGGNIHQMFNYTHPSGGLHQMSNCVTLLSNCTHTISHRYISADFSHMTWSCVRKAPGVIGREYWEWIKRWRSCGMPVVNFQTQWILSDSNGMPTLLLHG